MGLAFPDRLLRRDLGNTMRYSGIHGLYGDKRWIDDLDIVNELDGHTGCVNALRYTSATRVLYSTIESDRLTDCCTVGPNPVIS